MRVLFDGQANVHYGQLYVLPPGQPALELEDAFRGQVSGLLGAAVPGKLWMTTGLHTGHVKLTIRQHSTEPPVDPTAEDIVEASTTLGVEAAVLVEWAGGLEHKLDLPPGQWRVRFSGTAMDAARDKDTILDHEPHIDAYTLDFWKASAARDTIVRQTSEVAAYWHAWVATLKTQPR